MWDRLKKKKVLFVGKFDYGLRERLTLLAREHGATLAQSLAPAVDYVVSRSSPPKPIAARIKLLNAKQTTVQTMNADDFLTLISPSDEEVIAVIRRGRKGRTFFCDGVNPVRHRGGVKAAWTIVGGSFPGLDLSRFDFEQVDFESCDFSRTKLDGTEFAGAQRCKFDGCKGSNARIAKPRESSFKSAKVTGSDFSDQVADLDFTAADLTNSEISQWVWGSQKRVPGLIFHKATLVKMSFDDVHLVQPDFSQANLSKSMFGSTTVEAGDFRQANLTEAQLSGSTFRNADFRDANLRNAKFVDADLTGAKFDGADLTRCNLRGATTQGVSFAKAKGYSPALHIQPKAGPALKALDQAIGKAKRIRFMIKTVKPFEHSDLISGDTTDLPHGLGIRLPIDYPRNYRTMKAAPLSVELLQAARILENAPLRFETLQIKTTKSKIDAKELRRLFINGLCEAFELGPPDSQELTDQIKAQRKAQLKATAGARKKRAAALARAQAAKEKQAKKQLAQMEQKVVKAVGGKVSDIASFLKALEVRAEKAKIDKATAMLKAESFQLFNDITGEHLCGVVKSQTDPDLVYACRVESNGHYACCTQNLNICGGLRGSICKHLLVLIIGLVKAGQLDPATIDAWVAKSRATKPELNKETMGEIFIRFKGAEAGEVDWRPTETVPEDYYAL